MQYSPQPSGYAIDYNSVYMPGLHDEAEMKLHAALRLAQRGYCLVWLFSSCIS
jgi:hypothetical protein